MVYTSQIVRLIFLTLTNRRFKQWIGTGARGLDCKADFVPMQFNNASRSDKLTVLNIGFFHEIVICEDDFLLVVCQLWELKQWILLATPKTPSFRLQFPQVKPHHVFAKYWSPSLFCPPHGSRRNLPRTKCFWSNDKISSYGYYCSSITGQCVRELRNHHPDSKVAWTLRNFVISAVKQLSDPFHYNGSSETTELSGLSLQ